MGIRVNGVGMAMQGYRVKFLKRCKTVQATFLYRQHPRPIPENNAYTLHI